MRQFENLGRKIFIAKANGEGNFPLQAGKERGGEGACVSKIVS